LDLTGGIHKIVGNTFMDGDRDIGCFKVAIPYQSTSETKVIGHLPVRNSGNALF
jgi:hypothetical protein